MKKIRMIISYLNIYLADLNQLYTNTLLQSNDFRPHAIESGKFIALEYRYNFAIDYYTNLNFDYKNTKYYEFLKFQESNLNTEIYEGNVNYRFVNTDKMCTRFESLLFKLRSEVDHNNLSKYSMLMWMKKKSSELRDFDISNKREIIYNNKTKTEFKKLEISRIKQFLMQYFAFKLDEAFIHTNKTKKGSIIVGNGSHRLAAYKALHDLNLRSNKIYVRRP